MRAWGRVQCALWTHPDFLSLSGDGRLLLLYVLTGPHSNGIGAYRLPEAYVAGDLGWDAQAARQALTEVEGWVRQCAATQFVFVPGFVRWNPIENGKVARNRFEQFEKVPSRFCYRAALAVDLLTHCEHWKEPDRAALELAAIMAPEGVGDRVSDRVSDTSSEGSPGSGSGVSDTREERRGEREERESERIVGDEPTAPPVLDLDSPTPPVAPVLSVILKGGEEFPIFPADVAEWEQTFSAIDVPATLQRIRTYYREHESKRFTRQGARRAIYRWLAKDHDRAVTRGTPSGPDGGAPARPHYTRTAAAAYEEFANEGGRGS